MKITITFDIDLETRKAVAAHYGASDGRPAAYSDIKTFIKSVVETTLEDVVSDHQSEQE